MGLDMYAYVGTKGQRNDYYDNREIAYWRKHPNLHGWMQRLWESQGNSGLPATGGFFFGNNADEHYRKSDLEFIKHARAELFLGLRVFYNSSW